MPDGTDEHGNVEHHRFGAKRDCAFTPKQHFELGEALGGMDFETAAKLSGARFVVLKRDLARLERALGQFMLDVHTQEHGYTEVNPPLLVRDEAPVRDQADRRERWPQAGRHGGHRRDRSDRGRAPGSLAGAAPRDRDDIDVVRLRTQPRDGLGDAIGQPIGHLEGAPRVLSHHVAEALSFRLSPKTAAAGVRTAV